MRTAYYEFVKWHIDNMQLNAQLYCMCDLNLAVLFSDFS